MGDFSITREIGIDAGHRVMVHQGLCRHIHGHRYTIQATCEGDLRATGEQTDMVLDFGFLKKDMMEVIDHYCDHGFMACAADAEILQMFLEESDVTAVKTSVTLKGFWFSGDHPEIQVKMGNKLYVIPDIPTAEVLAKHWYGRLKDKIKETQGLDLLTRITVWETPNCRASFPSE